MGSIELYEAKVEKYWTVMLSKEQQVLTLDKALEIISSIPKSEIESVMAHVGCVNVFGSKKGSSKQEAKVSNLFLVKDTDNPYECSCGSEYYYVLLPDGNQGVDFKHAVIVPTLESVIWNISFILREDIVLGVPIEINEDYTLKHPAICICADCLSVRNYEYSNKVGLKIAEK